MTDLTSTLATETDPERLLMFMRSCRPGRNPLILPPAVYEAVYKVLGDDRMPEWAIASQPLPKTIPVIESVIKTKAVLRRLSFKQILMGTVGPW